MNGFILPSKVNRQIHSRFVWNWHRPVIQGAIALLVCATLSCCGYITSERRRLGNSRKQTGTLDIIFPKNKRKELYEGPMSAIRQAFLQKTDFDECFQAIQWNPFGTDSGKSGCSFWKSSDEKYFIKEVRGTTNFFKKLFCNGGDMKTIKNPDFIEAYKNHMIGTGDNRELSLLVRMLGLFEVSYWESRWYTLKIPLRYTTYTYVIMNNWHPNKQNNAETIYQQYDLKGSLSHRNYVPDAKKGNIVDNSSHRTWKDRDFIYFFQSFEFDDQNEKKILFDALKRDIIFLKEQKLMDYSSVPHFSISDSANHDLNGVQQATSINTLKSFDVRGKMTVRKASDSKEDENQENKVNVIYHVGGIIDFLQGWGLNKKIEKKYRSLKKSGSSGTYYSEVSCKHPNVYGDRFFMFHAKYFFGVDLENIVDGQNESSDNKYPILSEKSVERYGNGNENYENSLADAVDKMKQKHGDETIMAVQREMLTGLQSLAAINRSTLMERRRLILRFVSA